jgi:hypothetical protein
VQERKLWENGLKGGGGGKPPSIGQCGTATQPTTLQPFYRPQPEIRNNSLVSNWTEKATEIKDTLSQDYVAIFIITEKCKTY